MVASERMDVGVRGIGGEIKLFPPPVCHGEVEKWEHCSWQLKRYIGLCKPIVKLMLDDVEGANIVITGDLSEEFDIQRARSQTN